ncbi:hypothetical protein [Acanthopleuribacter pedis]|uniref:Uncharacterized protein n=1 Tax=Acanthopleuribacter pedis TaxID=442870 RepID=A0A8J7QD41_9BACT|nr:hypothetical protein [Acanthopleuribacter pedis]MBO1323521.1 hypothetical protein [Acanthopleuribacter pedis]
MCLLIVEFLINYSELQRISCLALLRTAEEIRIAPGEEIHFSNIIYFDQSRNKFDSFSEFEKKSDPILFPWRLPKETMPIGFCADKILGQKTGATSVCPTYYQITASSVSRNKDRFYLLTTVTYHLTGPECESYYDPRGPVVLIGYLDYSTYTLSFETVWFTER